MTIMVAFFDIGDTLGTLRFSASGEPISLEVFPYVRSVLADLQHDRLRLGVISNTGSVPGQRIREMLGAVGLLDAFEPQLTLFSFDLGMTKETPAIFKLAAEVAGVAPSECMYVGEDAKERATAIEAGMAACPHPRLASTVARGEDLTFAVIAAPGAAPERWHPLLSQAGALPLHLAGRGGQTVYAILSTSAAQMLIDARLDVHRLGSTNLPAHSDLYLVRDDVSLSTGFLQPDGQSRELLENKDTAGWLLSASSHGLVLAVPAGQSIESIHFTSALHGHTLKLRPDPSLLAVNELAATTPESFWDALQPPTLDEGERKIIGEAISADVMHALVARYSGAEPLGDDHNPPNIISRHVHRIRDNERAAAAAASELGALPGISAVLHAFDHEGVRLFNVEASLKGAHDEWVLVTAHLDSTAAFDRPYNSETDLAPGADDDASGVAGVIAAAHAIALLAAERTPERGVRFVLFNAEEHGLVGSKAYAREQAARGTVIAAVLQMDMIGYNNQPPRTFEIHAGFARSPTVEVRSVQLASLLVQVAATVSPDLAAAQVYPASLGEDDPADGRSDHSAFQERGYAACAATEDFFIGPLPDSPAPEGNPQYHRKADTFIDEHYAADIARAVAATAWLSAR